MRAVFLLNVLALCSIASAFKSYKYYELWQVEKSGLLKNNVLSNHKVDIWAESSTHVDVFINKDLVSILDEELTRYGIQYSPIDTDIDRLIQEEKARLIAQPRVFDSSHYNSFEDIEAFLTDVADTDPNASLNSIGKTEENRDLWVIKFSTGAGRPSVWLDCGIHAREWLSQSTCMWGVEYLSSSYGVDADVTNLLDNYDFYILPVYNADGYAYCWSDDRLWRKNRKEWPGNACVGTDLNRNFDNHFGGEGTSPDPCEEIYTGPSPASELETQAVVAATLDLMANSQLTFSFSIHTYKQLWMFPYGWTHTPADDYDEIQRVATVGVTALMDVYGTPYENGSISDAIYIDSGSSTDWTYAQGLVQTHTLELRPGGPFQGGFVQDASEIEPTAIETWAGIMAAIFAL